MEVKIRLLTKINKKFIRTLYTTKFTGDLFLSYFEKTKL